MQARATLLLPLFLLFTLVLSALPTSHLTRPADAPVETKAQERRARFERRVKRLQSKVEKRIEKRRAKMAKAKALDRDTQRWVLLGGAALLLLIILGAGGILSNIIGLVLGIVLFVAIVLIALYLLTDVF